MINWQKLTIDSFVEELRLVYERTYGDTDKTLGRIVTWCGRLALENIANSDGIAGHAHAVCVSRSVGLAAANGAAAYYHGPASCPVISTRVLIDARGAAELPHPKHNGVLPHPAIHQVSHQGGHALIEGRQLPGPQRLEILPVGVPVAKIDLHSGNA